MHGAHLIEELILKDPWETTLALGKKVKKTYTFTIEIVNLDVCKDESMLGDKLNAPVETKVNTDEADRNSEIRKLDKNLVRSVRIGVSLQITEMRGLIECIRLNADHFAASPREMSDINPSVAYH